MSVGENMRDAVLLNLMEAVTINGIVRTTEPFWRALPQTVPYQGVTHKWTKWDYMPEIEHHLRVSEGL